MPRKTISVCLWCLVATMTAVGQVAVVDDDAPRVNFPQLDDSDAGDESDADADSAAQADAARAVAVEAVAVQVDAVQLAVVARLVGQLGSASFADRERAAGELMAMGVDIVPALTSIVEQSDDVEIQLRCDQIIRRLTDGDLQTRINDFLAGQEVSFDGWNVYRGVFGDNGELRQMFVNLLRSHPDVLKSLDGTTRDRVLAMEKTISAVQKVMFVDREFPSTADTFALVMVTIDDAVPVTAGYESMLLSLLQKTGANAIRTNPLLAPPFTWMLGRVIPRTTLSSRIDMLLAGMSWEIPSTLTLAIATLGETQQTEVLAVALQAIARFGEKEHALLLTDLLDDKRDASEGTLIQGQPVRTQLGDLAMVTIAILYHADLKELGMGDAEVHPTYGFIIGDVGFPTDDPAPRAATRTKINGLLKGEPAS